MKEKYMHGQFTIALDVSFQYSAGGFGSYTRALLMQYIKQYHQSSFLLIENELPSSVPQYAHRDHYETISIPSQWEKVHTSRSSRLLWMWRDLPKLIKTHQPKLFHSVDNVTVPRKNSYTKTVLTLHDIIPLSHPQFAQRRDALASSILIPRALKHADKVITDSYYSAQQIINRFPKYADKINVVYLGVDHDNWNPSTDRTALSTELCERFGLYSPRFFFNVSTVSPRKNVTGLLRAFQRFLVDHKNSDFCLVVAGCDGWNYQPVYELMQELEIGDRVHFLGFVPDEELIQLNQAAYAFVFPSLLEGFGLPVLEAMACGTPVICSNTTSLHEMFAGSVISVNPLKVSSIQSAMNELVSDPLTWDELSAKGIELAAGYDWKKTASDMHNVYQSVLS